MTRTTGRTAATQRVPDAVKQEVTDRASELLARRFQLRAEDEARARKQGFNYVVSVFSEWRGAAFYLCAKYRSPRAGNDFVVRTTRLEYAGLGRFSLSYFRHTNRWQPVYAGLTVRECFETIEQEEVFWPIT